MPGGLIHFAPPYYTTDDLMLDNDSNLTQFKSSYKPHRNFAKQKFRLDYSSTIDMQANEVTRLSFKVVKYADLLYDTALSIQLPDIWSPIQSPIPENGNTWTPYEFKWIDNIGCHLIKEIEFNCGGQILQKFSGEYLAAVFERDMPEDKRKLLNQMTGNTPDINDPAFAHGRGGNYPSAYYTEHPSGAEPSLRGRMLTIPLHLWFTEQKAWAFPLCAVRDMDIWINITIRPIRELFRVRDITDSVNQYPYIQPDFGNELFQMYRFIQTPPAADLSAAVYLNKRVYWNADIHLISTQIFLDTPERTQFAQTAHKYLLPVVTEFELPNQIGTSVFTLPSGGLVSSWMIRFRRSDAYMRNEWDNYTNWPYRFLPNNIRPAPLFDANRSDVAADRGINKGPGRNPDGSDTNFFITGPYNSDNHLPIMDTMAIKLDGEYREQRHTRNIFQYVERYNQSLGSGGLDNGLYCYNFGLHTGYFLVQPTGYLNTSKFRKVELEFVLFTPQLTDERVPITNICNNNGDVIGVRKDNWRMFQYTFDIRVFEERYNLLTFKNGTCQFMYA